MNYNHIIHPLSCRPNWSETQVQSEEGWLMIWSRLAGGASQNRRAAGLNNLFRSWLALASLWSSREVLDSPLERQWSERPLSSTRPPPPVPPSLSTVSQKHEWSPFSYKLSLLRDPLNKESGDAIFLSFFGHPAKMYEWSHFSYELSTLWPSSSGTQNKKLNILPFDNPTSRKIVSANFS